jgi:hypothetical protein
LMRLIRESISREMRFKQGYVLMQVWFYCNFDEFTNRILFRSWKQTARNSIRSSRTL